ncbi:MAG: GNAT family N-acetyltransferase [Anaerolineae bacterium]|nr:GNAT family N-acetyltransferase [Anaerolineae bacterium]
MIDEVVPVVPGSQVEIVPAAWRDMGAIRELERLCFPLDAWPLLDMIGVLALPSVVRLKAEEDQRLVGFVAADVRRSKNMAWIATICVHPDLRGQGLGAALLEACEAKLDVGKVKLSVRASNQSAINLYKRFGYQQVDTWKRYYKGGEDATVMEKVVS